MFLTMSNSLKKCSTRISSGGPKNFLRRRFSYEPVCI